MSIGNDGLLQITRPEEINSTSSRQLKVSYTREYLLSLSDLEICKRLPKGFDESLLSEFGSSSLQVFTRNDYSSSPPGKGETGNIIRGHHRWDTRSSGRSDTDSQSDRDSESGRRYGNQFRRSWQNPEQDGLLGSGSFSRPPGYRAGASVPSFRANDQNQLNKSSDLYHPPRPYKAAPHLRRATKDSFNDETFGLDESNSEDRVEEERKRRAEFDMMRKEQQKELQEKLKSRAIVKLKDDPVTELAASLDSGSGAIFTSNGLDTSLIKQMQQSDCGNISISSQGHPLRPLVPPGFANAAAEKIAGPKSFEHCDPLEVRNIELGNGNKDEKSAPKLSLGATDCETTSPFSNKGRTKGHLSSASEISSKARDLDDPSFVAPNILEITEMVENGNMGIGSENLSGYKILGETGRSTSILEKLFGGALSINSSGPPDVNEDQNMKTHDVWSPKDVQLPTSKFAHLFLEEEKKMPKSESLEKTSELLSLIVGESGGLTASEAKPTQEILPLESSLVKTAASTPNDAAISEALCNNKKNPETISAFLTCEDLEQSILSNVGESSSSPHSSGIVCSEHAMENKICEVDVDKNASQHLLSFLQMGITSNSKTSTSISMLDPTDSQDLSGERISEIQGNIKDGDAKNLNFGKGLTLETLFGSSFMKELHSADAPVSVRRNSDVSSSMDVSEPSNQSHIFSGKGASCSTLNDAKLKMVNKDGITLQLGGGHQTNLDEVGVNWPNGSLTKMESSNFPSFGMVLSEEDSMTNLGRPLKAQSSMYTTDCGFNNAESLPLSSNPPGSIAEKLAALGLSLRDERPVRQRQQENPPFLCGPFDMVKSEIPHPSMHPQSSPQFHATPVNHMRPMFHPLDPHAPPMDPQFNFMALAHQDAAIHHQFPANMSHASHQHPSTGLSELDPPIHPMLKQLHMPNNLPPSHYLPGFPGGPSLPSHPSGNPPAHIQDHNVIPGFPFGQQQPNLGAHGLPVPGSEHLDMNNNSPQAFRRLLETELRSSQNPFQHPSFAAGSGHTRPLYGQKMDAAFWYR